MKENKTLTKYWESLLNIFNYMESIKDIPVNKEVQYRDKIFHINYDTDRQFTISVKNYAEGHDGYSISEFYRISINKTLVGYIDIEDIFNNNEVIFRFHKGRISLYPDRNIKIYKALELIINILNTFTMSIKVNNNKNIENRMDEFLGGER